MTTDVDNEDDDSDVGGQMMLREFCGQFSPVSVCCETSKTADVDGDSCISLSVLITAHSKSVTICNRFIYDKDDFAENMRILEDLRTNLGRIIEAARKNWHDKEMEEMLG